MFHKRVLLAVTASMSCVVASAADPLATAKQLAQERYPGWKYGSNASDEKIDCVQFVLAVVEESVAASLDAPIRKRILISDLSEQEQTQEGLKQLILADDPKIRGVQKALEDFGRGEVVPAEDAAPGDFIQYWMKKSDGTWFGHSGVIESVNASGAVPTAKIYGAHMSLDGIGTSTFDLKLIGSSDDRRLYVVRLTPAP